MMAEYIDRNELLDRIRGSGYAAGIKDNLLAMAIMIPVADVQSAKHGAWKYVYDEDEDIFFHRKWYCSACGQYNTYGETSFCPQCGAKMYRGNKDE